VWLPSPGSTSVPRLTRLLARSPRRSASSTASTGERVASSQPPPPTASLQPGAGPPGGTDDPMVAYLHLQAVGVLHIKTLITVVLDSTST
jgi:hypothetical protein